MRMIGIVGPTGAGKTTVLSALQELGGVSIDCDVLYHRLLAESPQLRGALKDRFGAGVFDSHGALDRKALGNVVFHDPEALQQLNQITHHHICREVDRLAAQARAEGRPAVAVDAVALLETPLRERCDTIIAVLAPVETRVKRIMAREGIPEDYARARVAAQKTDAYFEANCDHIFYNTDSKTQACRRALELFQRILKGG